MRGELGSEAEGQLGLANINNKIYKYIFKLCPNY